MLSSMKTIVLLIFFPLTFLLSCTSTPQTHQSAGKKTQIISRPATPLKTTTQPSLQRQFSKPPNDYTQWLRWSSNQNRVANYQRYLTKNNVHRAIPMHELLRSARDWAKCGRDPYAVPSPDLWDNMLPTLKVIQMLVDERALTDFEATSVYRDASLNSCAGGSSGSKHVYNSAVDVRLGPEYPTWKQQQQIDNSKFLLCEFWRKKGQYYRMGLGLYANGQIHIDTQGYRSWGPDLSYNSSMCNY